MINQILILKMLNKSSATMYLSTVSIYKNTSELNVMDRLIKSKILNLVLYTSWTNRQSSKSSSPRETTSYYTPTTEYIICLVVISITK